MALEQEHTANAEIDRAKNFIKINAPKKVNQFIPDYLQKTIIEKLDQIESEIRIHEEVITELNKAYMDHVNFLLRYNPFETGNLSQNVSVNIAPSPGTDPAPGREEGDEKSVKDSQAAH